MAPADQTAAQYTRPIVLYPLTVRITPLAQCPGDFGHDRERLAYLQLGASFRLHLSGVDHLGRLARGVAALAYEEGLAGALHWHFTAMWLLVINLLVYLSYGLSSGHFHRNMLPIRPQEVRRDLRAALGGYLAHRVGERNAVQRAL
jgi:thiosulfate reductase cytochrome b subunit